MGPSSCDYRTGLLHQARDGNLAAIDELFTLHQHYLRLLARSSLSLRVQSRVNISDVIQETYLHAYQAFPQFRGTTTAEFVVWLRTILASRIADAHEKHLKAARRDVRREISIDAINDGLSQSNAGLEAIARHYLQQSPGAIVAQQEDAIMVANAIGQLPEDYQHVIMMRHFDGLSFEQIADQMERTSGAVRMLWLRAIRKMKQLLTEAES